MLPVGLCTWESNGPLNEFHQRENRDLFAASLYSERSTPRKACTDSGVSTCTRHTQQDDETHATT
jgi:hypothetical protein